MASIEAKSGRTGFKIVASSLAHVPISRHIIELEESPLSMGKHRAFFRYGIHEIEERIWAPCTNVYPLTAGAIRQRVQAGVGLSILEGPHEDKVVASVVLSEVLGPNGPVKDF
jgi:hypothetical protein